MSDFDAVVIVEPEFGFVLSNVHARAERADVAVSAKLAVGRVGGCVALKIVKPAILGWENGKCGDVEALAKGGVVDGGDSFVAEVQGRESEIAFGVEFSSKGVG